MIDADELLTAFPIDDEPIVTKSCIRMTIQHMPTIETKQGEWIGDKCSVCGKVRTWCGWYGLLPNFCPDCGARMRGVDNETD